MKIRSTLLIGVLAFSALAFFQNCSKGIESLAPSTETRDLSSNSEPLTNLPSPTPQVPAVPNAMTLKNEWLSMTTSGAPSARFGQTAVWAGAEMIVWGGVDYFGNTGGGSNAAHTTSTGAIYNPTTNTWRAMAAISDVNPPSWGSSAIWTGQYLVTIGGWHISAGMTNTAGGLEVGYRYDFANDKWLSVSKTNAPAGYTSDPCAAWSGDRVFISGGYYARSQTRNGFNSYNPTTDQWAGGSLINAPTNLGAEKMACAWTGTHFLIIGGAAMNHVVADRYVGTPTTVYNTGGMYDPTLDTWKRISVTGFTGRYGHTAIWTGTKLIVFGGSSGNALLNSGAIYDPQTDSWSSISMVGAPTPRMDHKAHWTGSKMIVFGGWNGTTALNTGAVYDPQTDTWASLPVANSPDARTKFSSVWTGTQMIIFGGNPVQNVTAGEFQQLNNGNFLRSGGLFQ